MLARHHFNAFTDTVHRFKARAFTLWQVAILTQGCLFLFAAPVIAACEGKEGGESVVTEIRSGETLILEDGRAVRLAGVLTPKKAQGGPEADARAQMETLLAGLVMGRKISLHLDARERDRYGRVLAQVMVHEAAGGMSWLQEKLVDAGLARVISFQDNRLCIRTLLRRENNARLARKGLWGSGLFAVRSANAEDQLYRLARNYEIVEGRVSNVAQIKGRIYINFGQNWRRDFTVFIPSRNAPHFSGHAQQNAAPLAQQFEFKKLNGQRIRVRGWLKNYNGPSLTITHPEQIEILDADSVKLH